MGLAETAKLIAQLTLDDRKFTGGVNRAIAQTGKLESGFSRVGKGAGQVGAGLSRAGAVIATGVGAGLVYAAKSAISFEDAITGVAKTVDGDITAITAGLKELSTEIPVSFEELAGIAELGGAMGVAKEDLVAFTEQVAILGATTNVSSEEAATAIGQLQNVIGLTSDEFDNFAASLVHLGNVGASTEAQILEVTKRSGGAAKIAGIATDETLAWAAAAANLGLNEELAGTALQNFFIKSTKAVEGNGAALERMADIAGVSVKKFKKLFQKDATKALQTFLAGLDDLEKGDQLKAIEDLFGKGSGLTRLLIGLANDQDNLTGSLDEGTQAWQDASAAQEEFDKRAATTKSALTLLHNNVRLAAATVGEGFAPALGRAARKLSEFLKAPENQAALKALGEDIGTAIDSIDWQEVLDGAKTFVSVTKIALDYLLQIAKVIRAMPAELQAAAAGFLVLNKLSGGLIGAGAGNVLGGLAETITRNLGSKLPGALGKAFVQPVFVTNFPMGFGAPGKAGAAGAAAGAAKGGLSALSKVFLVGEAIGLAVAVNEVRNAVIADTNAQATALATQTSRFIASQPSKAALQTGLAGVEQGIRDIRANPLNVLVQGEALSKLEGMRTDLQAQIAAITKVEEANKTGSPADRDERRAASAKAQADAAAIKDRVSLTGQGTKSSIDNAAAKSAAQAAATQAKVGLAAQASRTAGQTAASATRSEGGMTRATIRASRPIVTVNNNIRVSATTVQKSYNVNTRYGNPNASRHE